MDNPADQPQLRRFLLRRIEDETGISGTGIVAEGVEFSDGTAAMRWRTGTSSTAVYASLADIESIHGHGGKTLVEPERPLDMVELADLRQYKRDHFGVVCPNGHHTRYADLVGDPNADDFRCAHCVVRGMTTA